MQIPEITDEDNEQVIDTENATQIVFSDGAASVSGTGASVSGSTVTVKTGGTYLVTGSTADGQLIVNAADSDTVKLVLQNANIQSATSAAIYVQTAYEGLESTQIDIMGGMLSGAAFSDTTEIGSFTVNSILSTVGSVSGMQGGMQGGGKSQSDGGKSQFGGERPERPAGGFGERP